MVDVTVRGAGIFGLSIAWACVRQGARVRVIDPAGPGAGSSGGIVGALAPHVPENWNAKKAFQLESLLMAESFWAGVTATGGLKAGYARTGRLQPIRDAAALEMARTRCAGAAEHWGENATWAVVPAEGRGWEPAAPSGWLIHDTLSARIHPRQACAALVAALRARDVDIRAEAPDAGRVVWATGAAGLEQLGKDLGRTVGTGIKGQAALLQHDARSAPQLFVEGLHVVPHADGTVAIGSTTEREFASPSETDALLDPLIQRARTALPRLADAPVVLRWAGLRPRTRSRAPMLGPWPGRAGHYIANGGFKIGFGMAPKVAEVMARLVLEDRDEIPEGFRVEASL
ncbi:FAD-binding oxidoreductase [Sulfitobacter sp. D35]|uniref:NAD(P)/FAD-dependent oxidoreductase n=1 Tax=Sulfitobacter sp. D35 TaxID=3083252 RepID=UPI00296F3208|nr:FAD-binding oxidoreductase [Sulfitobacter sp. D35]MDW4500142.1 FAD-binding oxidoreductase [Sulfitobacter sp. D35]